jgi:nucleotide-binding universal stress UspA family protein
MMFERILVPLDGSEAAEVALTYAAAIPSRAVRLLSVLPSNYAETGFEPERMDLRWRDQWQARMEGYLEGAAESLRAQGRQIEVQVVFGQPAEWILEYARDADLIAMTTHGRGGGRRALFGSVADRIARHSPTPVLLIRGGEHPIAARPVLRIVVPLDGSELAEQAVPLARELAETLGVPVLLARALDSERVLEAMHLGGSPAGMYIPSVESLRSAAEEYLERQAQELRNASIVVSTVVLDGPPAVELTGAVAPGDVLVMTSHGRGGIGRWLLGSVAEKLVRAAPAPVLLVRSAQQPAS